MENIRSETGIHLYIRTVGEGVMVRGVPRNTRLKQTQFVQSQRCSAGNAAHYITAVLRDWQQDIYIFFLKQSQ